MPASTLLKNSLRRRMSPVLLWLRSRMYSGMLMGFSYSLCASCRQHTLHINGVKVASQQR